MARPADSSQPRLAAGCRWAPNSEVPTVLFPEGAIQVQGTGQHILEQCDGRRTFAEVVSELQKLYSLADPARVREDAGAFLESLQQKRIVDY
jgi:pyrroloquinoline quinone biosynthesis protein D